VANYHAPRDFSGTEAQLLQNLADSAAVAIGNARFIEETQQARDTAEAREQQATQLYEVTAQLASKHDLDSVLKLITQRAVELTGGRGGLLFKYDEARGGLAVATNHNLNPEMWDLFVKPGEGNAGRAYVEQRAIWTNNMPGDPSVRYSDDSTQEMVTGQALDWGVVSVVASPVIIRDEVYGFLDVVFG